MDYFIEKNILLDNIIEKLYDNISYDNNIYNTFGELRNINEKTKDIILLNNIINDLNNIIYESNEYAKSIVDLEFQYNYICNYINDIYDAKYQIINFINSINEIDLLSNILSEFNIKN